MLVEVMPSLVKSVNELYSNPVGTTWMFGKMSTSPRCAQTEHHKQYLLMLLVAGQPLCCHPCKMSMSSVAIRLTPVGCLAICALCQDVHRKGNANATGVACDGVACGCVTDMSSPVKDVDEFCGHHGRVTKAVGQNGSKGQLKRFM